MSRRRFTKIVLWCFCLLMLLSPVYESFDRWDGFPKSGNDTMLNMIGMVAFCGLVLIVAKAAPALLALLLSAVRFWTLILDQRRSILGSRFQCIIGESPPPLLLLPLRI